MVESVADPSSPAPRNCSADAFQSCFIAETVAKKPEAHEFNRIAREVKRTLAVQKNKILSVCQLLLMLCRQPILVMKQRQYILSLSDPFFFPDQGSVLSELVHNVHLSI